MRKVITTLLLLLLCGSISISADHRISELELLRGAVKLNSEEKAFLNKIRERGYIKAACREKPSVYELTEDGKIIGFHYRMMELFSQFIGVDLKIEIVSFKDLYSNGDEIGERVITDADYSYDPGIFNDVDLISDTLTVLPWRLKIMDIIPLYPVKQLLILRAGESIDILQKLVSHKIAVREYSSYHMKFMEIGRHLGLRFTFKFVDDTTFQIREILDGRADISAQDSDLCILIKEQHPDLAIGLPISDIQMIGWGVSHNSPLMSSILKKFFTAVKGMHLFHRVWEEEFRFKYLEYWQMLR